MKSRRATPSADVGLDRVPLVGRLVPFSMIWGPPSICHTAVSEARVAFCSEKAYDTVSGWPVTTVRSATVKAVSSGK